LDEIARPTLDLTKQYLQVLPLQLHEEEPVVAAIKQGADRVIVYFSIFKEEFFLAICLDSKMDFAVYTTYIEPGSRVYLYIDNRDGATEIPASFPEVENVKSGFLFDPLKNEIDTVENKIEQLLSVLETHREAVKELASQTYVCLNVAYYGYQSQMWGFHFDTHTLRRFCDLNIEVDLDLYAGGREIEPFDYNHLKNEKER
jgi:hypothetical protein